MQFNYRTNLDVAYFTLKVQHELVVNKYNFYKKIAKIAKIANCFSHKTSTDMQSYKIIVMR